MPTFRELHKPGDPFILANAWDLGSARLLAALGAKALATTSAGHAFTLGRPDMGYVTRVEALEHARDLVGATSLPVSGDFENGYGHEPSVVAHTIALAAEAGLAGCSIEDTQLPAPTPYTREDAVARIRAAVDAARALEDDFVLVARADGVMNGQYDLDEAIWRICAYQDAGADCVYVPVPGGPEAQERVVRAVDVPVNALAVGKLAPLGVKGLADMGVARISLGSLLARMTHKVIYDEGVAMFERGVFSSHPTISGSVIDPLLNAEMPSEVDNPDDY